MVQHAQMNIHIIASKVFYSENYTTLKKMKKTLENGESAMLTDPQN
jgi:hypothetical protein